MPAVTVERGTALKEWAAVVMALESGIQILVLRKGGVREEGFSADNDTFFFYPTGFHQTGDKLKPAHRHLLQEARDAIAAAGESKVRIRSLGRMIQSFEIHSPYKMAALADEYVYTVDEMNKRYEFRPGDSLTALVVRVYRLADPVEIPVKTKYGGCVSWVHLDENIPTANACPVLSDECFQERLKTVRSLLS